MKIKQYINRLPSWLKNKYILATAFLFVWLLLFEQNNFISMYRINSKIARIENDNQNKKEEIVKTNEYLKGILNDQKVLEKFSRERYKMKKTNEDLFILVEKKDKDK